MSIKNSDKNIDLSVTIYTSISNNMILEALEEHEVHKKNAYEILRIAQDNNSLLAYLGEEASWSHDDPNVEGSDYLIWIIDACEFDEDGFIEFIGC